uniref:Aminotransferase-like plant mobile domain-containing protein n=1 Tax=Solanum lycopersicum TaxID=4081 RepID=K4BQI5_SOLLC
MNSCKDNEHEAFLSLCLSRFVFPCIVGSPIFSIAFNMARGMRLALSPGVLPSIYRDLGSLRIVMIETGRRNKDKIEIHKLNLWSSLFFVQVWAWERMISLQLERENEEWTIVGGQNLYQEMESYVRCLRVSEFVCLDFQEPYRPNRVAMQFGYDQDFPKWIPRSP